jgi:hypothetical protein
VTLPYTPVVLTTPIVPPNLAVVGAPSAPLISNSVYGFAPTAINTSLLIPSKNNPGQEAFVLADEIRRASRWVGQICFGASAAATGVTPAAGLSVESDTVKVRNGRLSLICNYKPIGPVIGIDVGSYPGNVTSIGSSLSAAVTTGIRTIYVPLYGYPVRPGDVGSPVTPWGGYGGSAYAVWSYVYGYPHTVLAEPVSQGATTCVVQATNGSGGLWGVFPGMTTFRIADKALTEFVLVAGITPGSPSANLCTLTTSAFQNGHVLPIAPDFTPVTTLPDDIEQACISLTTVLIKGRGSMAQVMPTTPGGQPSGKALGQAGATTDYGKAMKLLKPYMVRTKSKV